MLARLDVARDYHITHAAAIIDRVRAAHQAALDAALWNRGPTNRIANPRT
jgi:hypothetical protein